MYCVCKYLCLVRRLVRRGGGGEGAMVSGGGGVKVSSSCLQYLCLLPGVDTFEGFACTSLAVFVRRHNLVGKSVLSLTDSSLPVSSNLADLPVSLPVCFRP